MKGNEITQPTARSVSADLSLWISLHKAVLLALNSAVSHSLATIRQGIPTVRKRTNIKHIQAQVLDSISRHWSRNAIGVLCCWLTAFFHTQTKRPLRKLQGYLTLPRLKCSGKRNIRHLMLANDERQTITVTGITTEVCISTDPYLFFRQIRRSANILFKSETTTTSGNRSVKVQS